MTAELRSRCLTLIVLGAIGISLGMLGTAVGVDAPVADADSEKTFVVSERNVTVADGNGTTAVVENMSDVERVEIERENASRFRVETSEGPLTDSERERARSIARGNETVRAHLAELDAHELHVEPIQRVNVTRSATLDVTESNESGLNGTNGTFEVSVEDEDGKNGSVTVSRDPTYVEDEAVVRVRDPATDEPYYTIRVDLENETVVDVTDWREIRSG